MKKLVLFLAVAFSVSLFSCGGSNKANEADTTEVAVEEVAVVAEDTVPCCGDSVCADSCAQAEVNCEVAE